MKRLGVVVSVLVVALIASLVVRVAIVESENPLVVVHWANSHVMRDALLPAMAERFNDEDNETADGRPIEIKVILCDSSDQAADLVARVTDSSPEAQCTDDSEEPAPDPTIITPQSDDWLVDVNHGAPGVIDDDSAPSIAETWLGIVTYRAMAECMAKSATPLGYDEVIKVLEQGWDAFPACEPGLEWGDPPKLAFTNPNTSTSGRNVLISLYSKFAKVKPGNLTSDLIEDDDVKGKVKHFQTLVDHYMPGTIAVNTQISEGPGYGAFFLMPEDNLANLMLGNEEMVGPDGKKTTAKPPEEDLVMIYPHEGAVLNSNPAALVDAAWVTDELVDAAHRWTEYVLEPEQQQAFIESGFRPGEGSTLEVDPQQFTKWGLDPDPPSSTIEPGDIDPDVLRGILDSWGQVKKPAVVMFVVDVSGSMADTDADVQPIDQVKDGLGRMFDAMGGPDSAGQDSQVGLVTFGSTDDDHDDVHELAVNVLVEPGPLVKVRTQFGSAIEEMRASGGTPLYDAVMKAARQASAADAEPGATRAVVVLSDGKDNLGHTCMRDLVTMQSDEVDVDYCGKLDPVTEEPSDPKDVGVSVHDVVGTGSKLDGVQVFFIGFSKADIDIGRILAQATDGEYVKTDDDLAKVIEALSGYF